MNTLKTWLLSGLSAASITLSTHDAHSTPMLWSVESGGNGHSYDVVLAPGGIDWATANSLAIAGGGYLATLTSSQENNFVFGLVSNNPSAWRPGVNIDIVGPWLGGFQPDGSPEPAGNWQWVTGEPFAYTNWEFSEPNNTWDTGEDRLILWGIGGTPTPKWNDLYHADPRTPPVAFIVEYVPEPSAVSLVLPAALLTYLRKRRNHNL